MGIKEYGQAASEVELQDNPGPIKNQEGEAVIDITNDQDVGIGTSTPRRKLDILDASNPQLRLSRADDSNYADLETSANNNLIVSQVDNLIVQGNDAATFVAIQNTSATADSATTNLTSGITLGVNSTGGFLLNRYNGDLVIGTTNAEAIRIATDEDATFVANLSANGNVTLGDATADAHVVNGTLRLASEYSSGPSAPADGAGGILYVKDDGKLYFISEDVSETDLTSGGGGGGLTHETKSADFTAAGNFFYSVNSSGGNIAVTLPTADTAGLAGQTVDICHRTIGNTITITRSGSDTINGATTLTLSGTAFQNVTLFCTGAEWLIR